ncbi:MAG TPA: hypothetical protein VHW00_08675 [Thermoanaerobaculia bacterium]|nr:hypothetical protein [Thermoanaerobaculia bacterium]
MTRTLSVLALTSVFLVACASTRPAPEPAPDPETEATIVGAADEAVTEGLAQGEEAMERGVRIGRVAGVLAAVLGGPERESLDDMIERYRITRDATIVTATAIGTTRGAIEGAKRGYELDVQFAELLKIKGIAATRPFPDQIDIRFPGAPNDDTLTQVAAVFLGREERTIDIESSDDSALDIRETLIAHGLPGSALQAHRVEGESGILIRARLRVN